MEQTSDTQECEFLAIPNAFGYTALHIVQESIEAVQEIGEEMQVTCEAVNESGEGVQESDSDNSKLRRENQEKTEEIQEKTEEIQSLRQEFDANRSTVLKLQAELDGFKKMQSLSFAEMTNKIEKTTSERFTSQDYEQKKLQNDFDEFKVQAAMMVERSANQEAERKEYEHRLSSSFAVYEATIVKLEKELEKCQKRLKEKEVLEAQNAQSMRNLLGRMQEFERQFAELWRSTIDTDKQVEENIGFLWSKESSLQHQILELLRRTLGDDARLLSREVHE